jgi:hypothetical protein
MQSSSRLPSGRDRSNPRKPSGDLSDLVWFALMSALVVALTMMFVAISAGTAP